MSLERLWAGWRMAYVSGADAGAGAGAEGGGSVGLAEPGASPAREPSAGAEGGQEACVFCQILASGESDEASLIVWRGSVCVALLNAYPYASGHLMVLPARHVGDLEALSRAERAELWPATTDAVVALKSAYRPEGVNVGLNLGRSAGAGIPGHLHAHVVPRWAGDTNFMTTVAETRVLPEALPATWARLHAAWPATGTGG